MRGKPGYSRPLVRRAQMIDDPATYLAEMAKLHRRGVPDKRGRPLYELVASIEPGKGVHIPARGSMTSVMNRVRYAVCRVREETGREFRTTRFSNTKSVFIYCLKPEDP